RFAEGLAVGRQDRHRRERRLQRPGHRLASQAAADPGRRLHERLRAHTERVERGACRNWRAHRSREMALRPLKRIAALALCAATVAPAMAGLCAPEKLVRIETTNMSPGIRKDSFAAMPKVLYRLGSRKARLEEQQDPAE